MSASRSGLGQEELALLTPQADGGGGEEESGLSVSDGAHREGGREPRSRLALAGGGGGKQQASRQLFCTVSGNF